tara:strand:- start:488 stop:1123 length:636 start_codon:yes stop_codon:yes gene_type:complete
MTAQEVTFSNFYESTLGAILASGSSEMTLSAAPTSNGTSNIAAPYYLVIDPDNASNREVVLVTAASGVNVTGMTRDVEGRHSPDPTHVSGTTVRMAVVKEMFEDVHDRIDTGFILEDGDGTEQQVAAGKEVKFVEGAAIDINWTDVTDGTDADPYDMTFSVDIAGATDGTSVDVDGANDKVLLLDNSDSTVKKVNVAQLPFASIGLVIALS